MTCDSNITALRHRLMLEEPLRSEDEGGTANITWVPLGEIWAEIRPKGRREVMKDDGYKGFVTHEVRIRHLSGLDQTMRFRFGARVFDIRTIRNQDERNLWIVCECEERAK
jgi:SPP1 family predicted phage head-tail adaptor